MPNLNTSKLISEATWVIIADLSFFVDVFIPIGFKVKTLTPVQGPLKMSGNWGII